MFLAAEIRSSPATGVHTELTDGWMRFDRAGDGRAQSGRAPSLLDPGGFGAGAKAGLFARSFDEAAHGRNVLGAWERKIGER